MNTRAAVLGQLRHLLTFAGGYLSARSDWKQLDLDELITLLITLAGAAWSIWDKVAAHRRARSLGPASAPSPGQLASLFLLAGLCALVFGTSGCAGMNKLTTARIEMESITEAGTNRVKVVQPKDTVFKKLRFDPETGELEVTGYASAANAAAIAGQQAQTEVVAGALKDGFNSAMSNSREAFADWMHSSRSSSPPAGMVAPGTPGDGAEPPLWLRHLRYDTNTGALYFGRSFLATNAPAAATPPPAR